MSFKPLISQPRRCQHCNVLILNHSSVECTLEARRCGKCAAQGHTSKECTKHWSKFHCVNCEIGGHSAFDRRRCPVLVELEEAGCLAELKRLRKELGKPSSLTTDRDAKSYKAAAESNILRELEEIKRNNAKIQINLEKKQDNRGLLKDFEKLLEKNNNKIALKTHNQICDNIKKIQD
jgi:hypothetical protein